MQQWTAEEQIENKRQGDIWLQNIKEQTARMGSWSELQDQLRAQELSMRTCPECNKVCNSMYNMEYKHRDSKECLRLQAENRGEEFIEPAKRKVTCACGLVIAAGRMFQHQQTDRHKNKMKFGKGAYCEVCDKHFTGVRPMKAFKAHCKKKRHIKKLELANSAKFKKILTKAI